MTVMSHDHYVSWPHPSPLLTAIGGFEQDPDSPSRIGFTVVAAKANRRGFLHAGAIAAVADAAIGHTLARPTDDHPDPPRGLVTINLSCDLLGVARVDDWVEGVIERTRIGNRLAAGSALFTTDRPIARVTALFVPS